MHAEVSLCFIIIGCRSERSPRSPPARDTPTAASEHLVGMAAPPEATNGAMVPISSPNEADSVPGNGSGHHNYYHAMM